MKTCPHCGGDLWDDSTTTHAAHKDITNEWFDAFWQAYWRKRDKGHALKAFKRECESEETFLAIMKAIEVQGPEMR